MPKNHALGVRPFCRCAGFLFALLLLVGAFAPAAVAQTSAGPSQPLITQPINEGNLVALSGNTRPEANAANDRGIVSDSLPLQHMMLQLRRPAAQEQALETLIDQLHDPKSPNFHHWLSAAEFGAQFSPAASDIATITGWLQQHGFTVNTVYPSGMVIDFSGTAGQVRTAFHTEIHYHRRQRRHPFRQHERPANPGGAGAGGRRHCVAAQYPAAAGYTVVGPGYTTWYMTPPDLATIYNFNPLFTAGKSGQGQTIYLVEPTNLYAKSDWTTFRSTFGLSGYSGSLTTIYPPPPSGPTNCADPGVVGGMGGPDGEAILDAEYASAAAPSAAIVMATCENTSTFGGLIAVQNLVNGSSPPAIISMSYQDCEAYNGAAANAAAYSAYQQGVTEGTSIFVSAGDNDADVCDDRDTVLGSSSGIGVNGWSSTPYNVSVGGTDFRDTYAGTNSTYWNPTNTPTYGSAKSYIPEIPWNDSCGSNLMATFNGFSTTYGSSGFCNSGIAASDGRLTIVGGSGGPSGCASGTPSTPGVVSGTCAGWPKPSWQSGLLGNPADGVRDLPDVSLFAANGSWNHLYINCFSDTSNGGVGCTGAPNTWNQGGGTSFAAPIWAGIQALINQKNGGPQGNPNYRLYQLAANEYGTSGSSICNSSNGNTIGGACIFYDVTDGNNDADCLSSTPDCYLPSGTYGVMSTSTSSYQRAYRALTGWDFSTGIGTVNVYNVVRNWSGPPPIVAHDFNGDGYSDIAWRDAAGDLAIWLMNGTQILSSPDLGNVPTSWSIVGQRQFNNSGYADLLWRSSTGDLSIWFMNGTQILSTSDFGTIPTSWTIVGTSAYHASAGYAELFWRDTAGDLSIWQINGTQILAAPLLGNVPTSWTIAGIGDFAGTGAVDILWRGPTGDVAIWFMNGTQIVSAPDFINVPLSWTIVGTGDFNGDGKTDILWRSSTGDVGSG